MKKLLFILLYVLSPVLLAYVLFIDNPSKYLSTNLIYSMGLGAFAYTWLTWQFVISARVKWIESSFGQDRLYRIHGLIAIISIVFALIHKSINENIFSESLLTQVGSIALSIFIGITVLTLVVMVNNSLHNIKLMRNLKNFLLKIKVFRYQHTRALHNLTIIALLALQAHVLLTSSAHNSPFVFNVYMLYFLLAFNFYLYHKFVKPWVMKNDYYYVTRVVQETDLVSSIYFKPKNKKKLNYQPGQFGFFKFMGPDISNEEHPFSISSSPTQDEISITVKQLGDYTKTINQIKANNLVYVEAPFGRFSYLYHKKEKGLVFIVGGIGITPVLSMLRHLRDTQSKKPVVVILGFNTMDEFVAKDEVLAIGENMPNIKIIPVIAKDSSFSGEKGFIDKARLTRLLKELKWASQAGYYVCGPAILMNQSLKNLKELGIHHSRIHHEKFSL